MGTVRKVLVGVLVVGGFGALWLTVFTENDDLTRLIVWGVWALFAIAALVGIIRRSRPGRQAAQQRDPASFDPVQAVYQGRTAPTFSEPSVDASAQVTGPPSPDPLVLPDDPRRHDGPMRPRSRPDQNP